MISTRPTPHSMAPAPTADEWALLDFAVSLKAMLRGPMKALLPQIYETQAADAWALRQGRRPQSWRDVASAMEDQPAYRWWSGLLRAQQEFYLDVTSTTCEREAPVLIERFRELAAGPGLGSLTLDDSVVIPPYQADVDIHCVPGSYFIERTPDDVWAGARSDLGGFVFTMGKQGVLNDDKGLSGAAFVKQRFPDLQPRRILDLGCTIGCSTLPWCDAFPDAEVHALDLSAPSLRYGWARAQSLGKAVHFRQGDAEATPYGDGGFDLVVSHILLHETSRAALGNIIAEAHRLLAPGGVMLHIEVPVRRNEAFDQFLTNWDSTNNNEPFWSTLAEMDLVAPALEAGFPRESIFEAVVPTQRAKAGDWLGYGARKASI
ncbi:MAG: class I SAM-dependent methyltransferase [Pseudomonadota bacterium]|uniref:class I SAM-dependent methyltransferase n=1 Tax=Phenylobacterium sp. TaxID=1871053 RepID=UPI0025FC5974|nr:class I SAM-dependent methyltransferase [Phenylobacterium sp.]MBT9470556.1 class I SAM-dependent methyltransferase [Phenylobacterium sp.]